MILMKLSVSEEPFSSNVIRETLNLHWVSLILGEFSNFISDELELDEDQRIQILDSVILEGDSIFRCSYDSSHDSSREFTLQVLHGGEREISDLVQQLTNEVQS